MDVEVAFLPGEDAVHPVGARHAGAFHEIERRRVATGARAQEILGQTARLFGRDGGPRGVLRDLVIEPGEIAGGRDIGAEFFLLQGAEPAERPAPQMHARAHDPVGFLQAQFALQERLGIVVEGEAGGVSVAGEAIVLRRQELPGALLGFGAAHPKVDGSFRKGAVEIAGRVPGGAGQQGQADDDEAIVGRRETLFHGYDSLAAQCSPMPPRMCRLASTRRYPVRRNSEENSSIDTKLRSESGM